MNDDVREKDAVDTKAPDGLQEALNSLLANPSLMERISQIAGGLQTGAREESEASSPTLDPALLAKLPEVVQTLAPLLSQFNQSSPMPAKKQTPAEQRSALLLALKPFLSPERRAAADSLLRISQLSDVLGTTGSIHRK